MRFSKALNAVYRLILLKINRKWGESSELQNLDKPFFLLKTRMDADAGEVAGHKKFVQLNCTSNRLHKNHDLRGVNKSIFKEKIEDYLIEFQGVQ